MSCIVHSLLMTVTPALFLQASSNAPDTGPTRNYMALHVNCLPRICLGAFLVSSLLLVQPSSSLSVCGFESQQIIGSQLLRQRAYCLSLSSTGGAAD